MKLLIQRFSSLIRNKGLLKILVMRSFQRRFAHTSFGFFWTILTPLLISLVIAFVFTFITKGARENFVCYIISGMLPWMCFSVSLQESLTALQENTGLWKQLRIPLEGIVAASLGYNFVGLCIGLAVAMVFFAGSSLQTIPLFFLLPVPLILHGAFTLGIAFFLIPLYCRFKDTANFLNVMLLLWLWATPVFYLQEHFPPAIQAWFAINPVGPFLNLYRSLFYYHCLFSAGDLVFAITLSALSLIGGFIFFINQEQFVIKSL